MSHNKEFCIHFDNGFWKINPKIQYFTKYLLSLFGFPNIMYKPLVICFVILASFKVSVSRRICQWRVRISGQAFTHLKPCYCLYVKEVRYWVQNCCRVPPSKITESLFYL